MTKQEIKTQLEEILANHHTDQILGKGKSLSKTYWTQFKQEQKALEAARQELKDKNLEDQKEIVLVEEVVQMDNDIQAMIAQFDERKKAHEKSLIDEEKKNLEIKEGLIARFRNLIQHEENIGSLFGEMKEIQENWKEIGNIPGKSEQNINQQYQVLVEQFYYNINIYKELQDNDLKKNYSLKNQVVHKMKELQKVEKISELQNQLRILQAEWSSIGATYQEHWDKIKDEYYSLQNEIYAKIKNFYESRKEDQGKNIEAKQALLEKAKELAASEATDHKHWETITKDLKDLQDAWNKIGAGPAKENNALWKEFRGVNNDFFNRKKEYYGERNDVYKKNADLKNELIEKMEAIKGDVNFKDATQKILELQKKWKDIGHAGKFAEQKLWKKFRAVSDGFFSKKDEFFKGRDEENKANLELKDKLIAEIKAYKSKADAKATIDDLKAFSKQFSEMGLVPFKEKDRVHKDYKTALDAHYDALDLNPEEKEKILFQAKLDQVLGSANPTRAILEEKEKIRKRIQGFTSEITQYENNLGFFKVSKGSEGLLGDVNSKIEKAKAQIDKLKMQLRLFPKPEKKAE